MSSANPSNATQDPDYGHAFVFAELGYLVYERGYNVFIMPTSSALSFDYVARGAPYGPDDGTVAPWAAVASFPFASEIVLPTVQHFQEVYPQVTGKYCLRCSFNLTFPHVNDAGLGWTSPFHFGINLGPVVVRELPVGVALGLMRTCPYVVTGLRRAGFTNGWL